MGGLEVEKRKKEEKKTMWGSELIGDLSYLGRKGCACKVCCGMDGLRWREVRVEGD